MYSGWETPVEVGRTPPYRVGITGCGLVSMEHARAVESVDVFEWAACCDVDAAARESFADDHGVPATYADHAEMVAREPLDLVVVATWPTLHERQVLAAVEAGVPVVLCEKSLTTDAESAAEMVRTAAAADVTLVEGLMFRHHPRFERAVEAVRAGEVGELSRIHATYHMGGTAIGEGNWRADPDRAGGVLHDLLCYCVGAATAVADAPPRSVSAEWDREDGLVRGAWALVRYPDDVVAVLEASHTCNHDQELTVHGATGAVDLEPAWRQDAFDRHEFGVVERGLLSESTRTVSVPETDPFVAQLSHLGECMQRGRAPRVTPTESVYNHAVLDAVAESAAAGRRATVEIPRAFLPPGRRG